MRSGAQKDRLRPLSWRIVATNRKGADAGFAARRLAADRKRYELAIDLYLRDCYARRSVARVSELAELLGVPRAYLSRVVAQLFGRPLSAILREKQLAEAKRLLTDVAPLTHSEIAAASGFGHRSTFYRVFREAAGMTPGEYQRRFRK